MATGDPTPAPPPGPGAGRSKAFGILVGLTSVVVLLQGVWAGIFLEHPGRSPSGAALDLHSAGGSLATLLALAALVVASLRLRGRRDLWAGSLALFLLLAIEVLLGQLIHDSHKHALTAVHVPLAMLLMAICVWLPLRSTRR
jgi:uncharacterized membrane protein